MVDITDDIRKLYNKGLLPKKWNDKKVKKRDLPELLLDPEFNKQIESVREEPLGTKVQEYIKKLKKKQSFQEGGLALPEELALEAPTPTDPYSQLMDEYKQAQTKHSSDLERAKMADLITGSLGSVLQYGASKSAAAAQMPGGINIGQVGTQLAKGLKKPEIGEFASRAKMMKTLAELKAGGKAKLSTDPNSPESKAAQGKLKAVSFDISDSDLLKLSQKDIEKNMGAFIRKSTRKIEKKREGRLEEAQAWRVGEKDEVSDKQLESITDLDNLHNMINRAKELRKTVKLSGGIFGPKPKQIGTQLAAEYLGREPDEDYAALQALVENQMSDYIKSKSGLTVSDSEATRLGRAIPTMSMPDKQFDTVMKQFEITLKEIRNTRFKNIKGYQGKLLPFGMVKSRESLIKKVKARFPEWDRSKAIRYLKEKERW